MNEAEEADEVEERAAVLQLGLCLGCFGLIAASLLLFGWAMSHADDALVEAPPAVEALAREALTCAPPPGYRGYRGLRAEGRLIALFAKDDYTGRRVPLDQPLVIGVWTFKQGEAQAQRAEVAAYWRDKAKERFGAEVATRKETTSLRVRGVAREAEVTVFAGPPEVRVEVLFLPGAPEAAEQVALSFVGATEGFDRDAQRAFLETIR